jgi:hypothetical protein
MKPIFMIAVNYNTDYNFDPDYKEITIEKYLEEHPNINDFNQMLAEGYCYLDRIEN